MCLKKEHFSSVWRRCSVDHAFNKKNPTFWYSGNRGPSIARCYGSLFHRPSLAQRLDDPFSPCLCEITFVPLAKNSIIAIHVIVNFATV